MARKAVDLAGKKFGRLTAVERNGATKSGNAVWRCRCDCGSESDVESSKLTSGKTKSCGCLMKDEAAKRMKTHGMSKTPTWYSWDAMVRRCTDESFEPYKRYGGRGIKVCESWMRFENFLADMGERPEGTTLDRRDNDKGYEPDNCRWATFEEQSNNRGDYNLKVERGGENITVAQLAEIDGVSLSEAYRRANKEKK